MNLDGATALVTGASGGLGQAIARQLAGAGARVIITGRRGELLDELAAQIDGRVIVADLADRSALEALLAEAGRVDVLVANAALPASGLLTDYSITEIDRSLEVNLRAPIVLARLAAAQMTERHTGHLVFISSLSGKAASGRASLYNASKFGLRGFALGLRADLRPYVVGVSAIFPGFIRDAGMFAESGTVLPRGVGTRTPDDVAKAVLRAVRRDIAELDVAPLGLRLGAKVAGLAPQFAARVQRLSGSDRIAQSLAEAQAGKR